MEKILTVTYEHTQINIHTVQGKAVCTRIKEKLSGEVLKQWCSCTMCEVNSCVYCLASSLWYVLR